MADEALFRPVGPATFEPTAAAVGPWDATIVHGAAVAALLAGRMAATHGTLARLTIDLLAPVPMAPLALEQSDPTGGARVQRRRAALSSDGRTVATADSVVMRRAELDLPEKAVMGPSPFPADSVPDLDQPNRAAIGTVGHESFDSTAVIVHPMRVEGDRRVHLWVALALPVVEGEGTQTVETAAVAADYAQSAVSRQLPFTEWSFRNAEQTLHLARVPIGRWVGMRSESAVGATGAGFNTSDLFDAHGRFGHSAAAVVVEPR